MEATLVQSQKHSQALAATRGRNRPPVRADLPYGSAIPADGRE